MKCSQLKCIVVDNRPECQWTKKLLGRVNKHFELDWYANFKRIKTVYKVLRNFTVPLVIKANDFTQIPKIELETLIKLQQVIPMIIVCNLYYHFLHSVKWVQQP